LRNDYDKDEIITFKEGQVIRELAKKPIVPIDIQKKLKKKRKQQLKRKNQSRVF